MRNPNDTTPIDRLKEAAEAMADELDWQLTVQAMEAELHLIDIEQQRTLRLDLAFADDAKLDWRESLWMARACAGMEVVN